MQPTRYIFLERGHANRHELLRPFVRKSKHDSNAAYF